MTTVPFTARRDTADSKAVCGLLAVQAASLAPASKAKNNIWRACILCACAISMSRWLYLPAYFG